MVKVLHWKTYTSISHSADDLRSRVCTLYIRTVCRCRGRQIRGVSEIQYLSRALTRHDQLPNHLTRATPFRRASSPDHSLVFNMT